MVTIDDVRLQDLIERLAIAAGLEAEGVPLVEIVEYDDECAELAAHYGSFEVAYEATREAFTPDGSELSRRSTTAPQCCSPNEQQS